MSLNPVDALAAARIVRLVRADRVAEPIREWLIGESYVARGVEVDTEKVLWVDYATLDPDPPAMVTFLGCSWCIGVWASAFVIAARTFVPGLWDPLARVLATSMVASVIELGADRA